MGKQYASSVYSQKSTTSAKSSRSFLSLTTPVWPTTSLNEPPTGVWQNIVKTWIYPKKKNDTDSIITNRSSTSINKLKQLLFKKKPTDDLSPRHSITTIEREEQVETEEEAEVSSFTTTTSTVKKKQQGLVGILANCGCDSEEAILERKKRRAERREYILRQQKQNRTLQHHHIIINDSAQTETSSSDTLLADEDILPLKSSVKVGFAGCYDDDDDEDQEIQEAAYWEYNPRIMFVEPSPVPRFRNVAPPPPPSPAYLNILTHPDEAEEMIIRSPLMDEEETTVFSNKSSFLRIPDDEEETPLFDEEEDEDNYMQTQKKPRLYFHSPLQRGQTLRFSLQNTIPEDHIILFKFLTSNTAQQQPERYFVQPSAGKMDSNVQSPILLILNQPPNEFVKKDRIMIRWAVIQKNTNIEHWVNNLQDSTRRRWIDMLDEEWPNQVTIRMTRIKIRFL